MVRDHVHLEVSLDVHVRDVGLRQVFSQLQWSGHTRQNDKTPTTREVASPQTTHINTEHHYVVDDEVWVM